MIEISWLDNLICPDLSGYFYLRISACYSDLGQSPINNAWYDPLCFPQMLFYILFCLSYCCDFFCIFVRDLKFEFFFQGHDQFNQVKGVGIEIFGKRSAGDNLTFFNAKLLDDNTFETFAN